MSRDSDVRRVAAELEQRLQELRETVTQLNAILLSPEADPGQERRVGTA
jgi:hypothetical protein